MAKKTLTLTAYAPLHVVSTANYLRYGPEGVQRYGPNATSRAPVHPHQVTIHMTVKNIYGEIKFDYPSVLLQDSDPTAPFDLEGTTVWMGSSSDLQITWVWDFYRMFSGIRLEVKAVDPQNEARISLQKLQPGDQIIMNVSSKSGDILQMYHVDEPAVEMKG